MRAIALLPLAVAASACTWGSDSPLPSGPTGRDTTPPAPVLTRVAGDSQTGMAGSTLPAPLEVVIRDSSGSGVAGVTVQFAAVGSNATLTPPSGIVRTGDDGRAGVVVRLGMQAGEVRVVAASPDVIGTASFTLLATPAPPPTIVGASGDSQVVALPGAALDAFVVIVRDFWGRPASGQPVTFRVTSGAASFAGQSSRTVTADGRGFASAALTTPAPAEGESVQVEASIPGDPGPARRFVATGLGFRGRRWEIGASHACAIAAAGGAYCWGNGADGRLGTGNWSNAPAPTRVAAGAGLLGVYAGATSTCGLGATGVVTCWGSFTAEAAATRAFRSVSAAAATSWWEPTGACGVSGSGGVFCWGGYSSPGRSAVRLVSVSVGSGSACGLTAEGRAYCWGANHYGQLGTGDYVESDTLVPVSGGPTFTDISAGYDHTCAVTAAGAAYCWGSNTDGRLGVADSTHRSRPTAVVGGLAFTDISAGYRHTCAVTAAGATYCWGRADSGQLGNGATSPYSSASPVEVLGGHTFAAVRAGDSFTCAIDTAGQAWCWGANTDGQLGIGSIGGTAVTTPTAVTGGLLFIP